MKSLVSAIALAAAVSFAVPAMAQAPAPPNTDAPTMSKPNAAKPKASKTKAGMHRKHATKAQRHGRMHAGQARNASATRRGRTPSDNVANQLNQQEKQRMSGSSMQAPGSQQTQPGTSPAQQGQ